MTGGRTSVEPNNEGVMTTCCVQLAESQTTSLMRNLFSATKCIPMAPSAGQISHCFLFYTTEGEFLSLSLTSETTFIFWAGLFPNKLQKVHQSVGFRVEVKLYLTGGCEQRAKYAAL